MKILHTADWHLGKRLDYLSRLEEQHEVLAEIVAIANEHKPDAILIAGDIFDSPNPPIEALELFYQTAKTLSRNGGCAVIGIAGNHDSPDRIEAPDPLARACGILLCGYPHTQVQPLVLESGLKVSRTDKGFVELQLPHVKYPLRLIHTAYANEPRLRTYLGVDRPEEEMRQILAENWKQLFAKYCDNQGVNVLMTHLFVMRRGGNRPEEHEDEKTVLMVGGAQEVFTDNFPKNLQYVALGHIHRQQIVDDSFCPVVYSGSPLCYSMAEAGQEKYVMLVELEPAAPAQLSRIPLTKGKPLVRTKVNSVAEAVSFLETHTHAIVELTLRTDTYLTAAERKLIYDTHPHVFFYLEMQNTSTDNATQRHHLDLTQNIEELFLKYFEQKHQKVPNPPLLDIFREILADEKGD